MNEKVRRVRNSRSASRNVSSRAWQLNRTIADELNARAQTARQPAASVPSSGLYVMHVTAGSPAHHAGVRVSDTIVGIGERPLHTTRELIDTLSQHIGEKVQVKVRRGEG